MRIFISGWGSLSPLGFDESSILQGINPPKPQVSLLETPLGVYPTFRVAPEVEEMLKELKSEKRYRNLDRAVLLAILAGRQAIGKCGWQDGEPIGVSVGNARGATEKLEALHSEFLSHPETGIPSFSSPVTTAGNIASWLAQDLKLSGPEISLSMTCTSAFHAIATGSAYLKAGYLERWLAGGSEAPLTPFTLAQMSALRIYADPANVWPCRPLSSELPKPNTLVLGEGAGMVAIESSDVVPAAASAEILGIGWGLEKIQSPTGMSNDGEAIRTAMAAAIGQLPSGRKVDCVVAHATGTVMGDASELEALRSVFNNKVPFITSTKFLTGHTFGASGMLSLELALRMLKGYAWSGFPYPVISEAEKSHGQVDTVLINTAGFGGSAVTLIVGNSREKQA